MGQECPRRQHRNDGWSSEQGQFIMWTPLEPWQVSQIEQLSRVDRSRVEGALNSLWESEPGLFQELTISALDQGQISRAQAGRALGISEQAVEAKLQDLNRRKLKR